MSRTDDIRAQVKRDELDRPEGSRQGDRAFLLDLVDRAVPMAEGWMKRFPMPEHPVDFCPVCYSMGEHERGCVWEATEQFLCDVRGGEGT